MIEPEFHTWCNTRGIRANYRSDVIEKDRSQAEFTLTLAQYLDRVLTADRISTGQTMLARYRAELTQMSDRFGVDPSVIVAIWGVETSYGKIMGDIPVIDALATLAFDGRRAVLFNDQLTAFLPLLDTDIPTSDIKGSWAGAFGHTQFMPTSYRDFALSFSGQRIANLWGASPLDALASSGNYLRQHNWVTNASWGQEVHVPEGFDYALLGRHIRKPSEDWRGLGVATDFDQEDLSLILPMGVTGPAFLVGANFACVETYNRSETYVFAVCLLADAIAGRGGSPKWPTDHRALLRADRIALQQGLTREGFDTFGADGIFGPNTYAALRAYQSAQGLIPDGYASFDILNRLMAQPSL